MKLGTYNLIEKIIFSDNTTTFFLIDTEQTRTDLDVDLFSELWFNEFRENKIKSREKIMSVNHIDDVLIFLDKKGISYKEFYLNGTLRVGGEHDMLIYKDLSYEWDWEQTK